MTRLLEKSVMSILSVNYPDKYLSRLQKPDKVFLQNPNLFYALNPEFVNTGSLRETFALNHLSNNHEVFLHKSADFIVDQKFVFEIGGKNKSKSQITGIDNAFLLLDEIETGYKNSIPLWLLGLLF